MKYRDFSGEQAPNVDLIVWSGPGASLPIAAIADVALWQILLQKSFCIGNQKFCGLQARLSCKDVRDLIASR
jgi:hypothetical protein